MSVNRFIPVRAGASVATLALAATLSGCQAQSSAATASEKKAVSTAAATAKPKPTKSATPKITTPPDDAVRHHGPLRHPGRASRHHRRQVERFTLTTSDPTGCTLTGPLNLSPKGPLSAQVPGRDGGSGRLPAAVARRPRRAAAERRDGPAAAGKSGVLLPGLVRRVAHRLRAEQRLRLQRARRHDVQRHARRQLSDRPDLRRRVLRLRQPSKTAPRPDARRLPGRCPACRTAPCTGP
jgi:hypothetical protein